MYSSAAFQVNWRKTGEHCLKVWQFKHQTTCGLPKYVSTSGKWMYTWEATSNLNGQIPQLDSGTFICLARSYRNPTNMRNHRGSCNSNTITLIRRLGEDKVFQKKTTVGREVHVGYEDTRELETQVILMFNTSPFKDQRGTLCMCRDNMLRQVITISLDEVHLSVLDNKRGLTTTVSSCCCRRRPDGIRFSKGDYNSSRGRKRGRRELSGGETSDDNCFKFEEMDELRYWASDSHPLQSKWI